MKSLKYINLLLATVLGFFQVSCVNDNLSESYPDGREILKPLSAQVEAMKVTADELSAILSDAEGGNEQLEAAIELINGHVSHMESGASLEEATLAAMDLQRKFATAVAAVSDGDLGERLSSLEKGVSAWIGNGFTYYYPLALKTAELYVAAQDLENCSAGLSGIRSDVESGLKEGVALDELKDLAESVDAEADRALAYGESVEVLLEELEAEYAKVIHAVCVKEDFDGDVLKKVNESAAAALAQTEETYASLSERISECEAAIADLNDRLVELEADVDALLEMIQSLTFVSDYSADCAYAYYALKDGKREPVSTFGLSYIVRPASAAKALAEAAAKGNDAVSVIGYYVGTIALSSVSEPDFIDFEIEEAAVLNEAQGLVRVSVNHNLSEDFFLKKTGARCALSVVSGKTDMVAEFVEIRPKDNSSIVYLEGIKISDEFIELDNGESKTLSVTITPSNATDKSCHWVSSNTGVAEVDPVSGKVTAVGVGEATVTVTTNGTDEWGMRLSASCNVRVNSSIRLSGAPYVEVGKTSELILDYPSSMVIESRQWSSSDNSKATVDERGVVTAVANTYNVSTKEYNEVTFTCKINGTIELSHAMKVVVPQPKSLKIDGLADDQNQVVMKVDKKLPLTATLYPENVDAGKFRLMYQSDQGLGWINSSNGVVNEYSKTMNPGTAWVYIDVLNLDQEHYLAPGVSLRRVLTVKVEPYWVTGLSFPSENVVLEPGQSSKLTPVFMSDVDGVQPTYTDLVWSSSNPDCVSVDPITGELVTLAEGSARITATTCHDWSVPDGASHVSASCNIVVEKPTTPVNVGDYYYSDGTWSTARDYNKTVIGIVFAKASPATADKAMMTDYPKCTHGLVVALKEYSSAFGLFGYATVYTWLSNNGYEVPDVTRPNGYGLTKGLGAYRLAYPDYCELFDSTNGPAALQNASVKSPASSWYIPSYYEMKLLWEQKSVVNASLSAMSATQVSDSYYWASTLRICNQYNDCQGSPFNMATGDWYSYDKKSTSYPVRVILAF